MREPENLERLRKALERLALFLQHRKDGKDVTKDWMECRVCFWPEMMAMDGGNEQTAARVGEREGESSESEEIKATTTQKTLRRKRVTKERERAGFIKRYVERM